MKILVKGGGPVEYRPLADDIRPLSLDDVVGQRHILGENGMLRRIIESGSIPNMVFYGPSGTGKTTVANIIARQTQPDPASAQRHHRGNSPISGHVMADVDTLMAPNGVSALPGRNPVLQ